MRLGVTGLSRAGKTVFVTSLIQNLVAGSRLPVLAASAEGRIARVQLDPQPDDAVPRFPYEEHLAALSGPDRHWPQSTRRISQLRLTIEFERASGWGAGPSTLHLDIVDYPGEWLLDLPLLDKILCAMVARDDRGEPDARRARRWRATGRPAFAALDPTAPADENAARVSAALFTAYLRRARDDVYALSTLPPGRFLMPGDLEGSPALTFSPLPLEEGVEIAAGSLAAMMERRYEAYKTHVVRPFFRDHFCRLDRQIVLVDALTALNSGPAALRDLENALGEVLNAFRAGRASRFATLFRPRIDRILFAATKADHLHHSSHDRLEAILRALTARAIARAEGLGAEIDVDRARGDARDPRGAKSATAAKTLDAIIGVPEAGEKLDGQIFDGVAEAAVFPGQLPEDPAKRVRGRGDRAARGGERLAVPALPAADHGARRARAPHPARPRAAIPDRRQTGMSEHRPRPRAFRLDDETHRARRRPAPFAPTAVIRTEAEPIPASAQAPSRSTRASARSKPRRRPACFGAGARASPPWSAPASAASSRSRSACGRRELIEGLFAKAQALGWIAAAFAALFAVGVVGLAIARDARAYAADPHRRAARGAGARALADDRDAARAERRRRLIALYENRPGDRARARRSPTRRWRAIIDGRDLVDVAERALLRPLDAKAQAEIAAAAKRVSLVTAISPRAVLDRDLRRRADRPAVPPHRGDLWRTAGPARLLQARPLDRRPPRDHRRHGGRRLAAAADRRPRHRVENLGPHGRRRAQRLAHGARRAFRAGRVPAGAVRRAEAARGLRRRAVPIRRRQGRVRRVRCRTIRARRRPASAAAPATAT